MYNMNYDFDNSRLDYGDMYGGLSNDIIRRIAASRGSVLSSSMGTGSKKLGNSESDNK